MKLKLLLKKCRLAKKPVKNLWKNLIKMGMAKTSFILGGWKLKETMMPGDGITYHDNDIFKSSKIKLIKVDFLEFVTFMIDGQAVTSNQKEIHSSSTVNESSDDVCTAAFSIFDADKDGLISPSDLR